MLICHKMTHIGLAVNSQGFVCYVHNVHIGLLCTYLAGRPVSCKPSSLTLLMVTRLACRVHQKMVIAAGEPCTPASTYLVIRYLWVHNLQDTFFSDFSSCIFRSFQIFAETTDHLNQDWIRRLISPCKILIKQLVPRFQDHLFIYVGAVFKCRQSEIYDNQLYYEI